MNDWWYFFAEKFWATLQFHSWKHYDYLKFQLLIILGTKIGEAIGLYIPPPSIYLSVNSWTIKQCKLGFNRIVEICKIELHLLPS